MAPDSETMFACVVCGEQVDERLSSECNWCDGRFHLNPRNDIEAKDCGRVWLDESHLALQFACNTCLGETNGVIPGPDGNKRSSGAARGDSARQRRYKRRA